jgi:hypothetical protein
MTALFAALAAALAVPTMAQAGSLTVTGDDGNPVALNPAAPPSIRNMDVKVGGTLGATEKYYSLSVAGPAGPAAYPADCLSAPVSPRSVDYQGNGTYTATLTTYSDYTCAATKKVATVTATYNVGAGVALSAPPGKVLTRQPNSVVSLDYNIPIALNPGALGYEVRIAKGGVLAPDGSISGPSEELFVDKAAGTVGARFQAPGSYLIVARAKAFSGSAGQFYSPWSAPITVNAIGPFDFQIGSPRFVDRRGPSYKLKVKLTERSATGKVKIYAARGKGRYHSLGKAKIRRGKFAKRFTLHKTGKYRMKYVYKGSATVAPGTVVQKVRITRRVFF